MRLALYQPDIPQNTGAMLRMCACLGVAVDVIGPAAFDASERALKRAALDYLDFARIRRHVSFAAFDAWRRDNGNRLIIMTTRGKTPYTDCAYHETDILLAGRESAGVPSSLLDIADVNVIIHMRPQLRSLNVATAAAMVLGEALRQTGGFEGIDALAANEREDGP